MGIHRLIATRGSADNSYFTLRILQLCGICTGNGHRKFGHTQSIFNTK